MLVTDLPVEVERCEAAKVRRLYQRCRGVVAVGACAGVLVACASNAGRPPTAAQPSSEGGGSTLSLTRGDWPVELQNNEEWRQAAQGNEWALLGVARQRAMLLAQVERGGPAAAVALRAWSLAPEAWVERGGLCRALPRYAPADWGNLLAALHQSLAVEDAFGEVLDVDAKADCASTLDALRPRVADMPPSVFDEYVAACQALRHPTCPERGTL